ncbi:hypothetical protein LJC59_09945 [Desulfovibrio sp. OttesenSCG-928-A18]|nr:hypothetical protein [Desulfovibrio sp. OttesenSCG-928-A18]
MQGSRPAQGLIGSGGLIRRKAFSGRRGQRARPGANPGRDECSQTKEREQTGI